MKPDQHYKPGASDRNEHGKWVSRPYGLRARETRSAEKRQWKSEVYA